MSAVWTLTGVKRKWPRSGEVDAIDPQRTPASISCCSSETGFSLYQSTRLSRYDAALSLGPDIAEMTTVLLTKGETLPVTSPVHMLCRRGPRLEGGHETARFHNLCRWGGSF
jgi:hypothetical protein